MTELLSKSATTPTAQNDSHPPRLLDQLRAAIRRRGYSLATEKNYVYWTRFYIHWHALKHPKDMGAQEVESFLSMLATARDCSPSTQRQALAALLFLYKQVLDMQTIRTLIIFIEIS